MSLWTLQMSTPGVAIALQSLICITLSFPLCKGSSQWSQCLLWYTMAFMRLAQVLFGIKTALLIHNTRTWATSTKLIHGKQNLPIVIQPCGCIMPLFLQNHSHFRPKDACSDHAFWQSPSSFRGLSCDPLRPNRRLSAPAAWSGRMASLYVWGAWWEKQCRECGLLYQWPLPEHSSLVRNTSD